MIETVFVEDAVGKVLCHDLTRIVPGEYKGPAFRKGHIISEADIPELLKIGKEHIYVLNLEDDQVHENEAAERIARAAAGPGISCSTVCEGRVNLVAAPGLLCVKREVLYEINSIEEIVLASMHNGQQITAKKSVAGTRVVPLVIERSKIEQVEQICRDFYPVIESKPFKSLKVGVVTTGSEVFNGRIKDKFGPVVCKKFKDLNCEVIKQVLVSDDPEMTRKAIMDFIEQGAEMVVVTGGMSVDPDDQTPASIRSTGAEVVTYGAPTFPGAMFMLAYLGDVPIVGLPGCVMYYRASIFDLVVPRLAAGERVTRDDIVQMGHGGFCAECEVCRYPVCPFGKN